MRIFSVYSETIRVMEQTRYIALFIGVACLLPFLNSEHDESPEYDDIVSGLTTNTRARRCWQSFREKTAHCERRNLEHVPRYLHHGS